MSKVLALTPVSSIVVGYALPYTNGKNLEFEKAAEIRDMIAKLRNVA